MGKKTWEIIDFSSLKVNLSGIGVKFIALSLGEE
jgi:hypothetical protein